jgi:CHAD domain-containing protein
MTTSVVREVERKYDAQAGQEPQVLSALAEEGPLSEPDELRLEAVYFDTAELGLARAGMTLRYRSGGDDDGWTLKLPAGADGRDEIRVGQRRDRRRRLRPPEELLGLVRAAARGAPLDQVVTISTVRTRRRLATADGQLLAEVVDDEVSARGTDGEPRVWREIEVELGEAGDLALLDRIEARLASAGVHRSASASKLARAMGERLPAPEPRPELGPRSPAGEVVLAYLRDQADAIRRNDPLVRRQAPDAVHQMRVACRRMRSGLQAFGRVVERDRTRAVTDELKWLAGVLGEARDLEVLHARFATGVAGLPVDLVLGPVEAQLTRYFGRREADAHAAVVTALDGDRYLALLAALDALLADPPLTPLARRPAKAALPRLLRRAHRRVAGHMEAAERASDPDARDVELHEGRKAAKRLRYAAEAGAPALGRPTERLGKAAKALQEILGEHQDAVVARPVLRELAVAAQGDGESAFTFGLLHERETGATRRAEADVEAAWRDVEKRVGRVVG